MSPQFPLSANPHSETWCEAAKPGVAATSMPNLSRTKKVVKVLVVSEMNIASGATDMDFFAFFFKKKRQRFFVSFFGQVFVGFTSIGRKHIPKLWTLESIEIMEIPSVAFQRNVAAEN